MKITRSSKIQSLILAAALSIGLGFVSPVLAQQVTHAYIVDSNGKGLTDLGTLGGSDSYARGINDAGQVVGYSDIPVGVEHDREIEHAFITGPAGVGMTVLGDVSPFVYGSGAYGINDAGQVVGDISGRRSYAFVTGPNGVGMTLVETPPPDPYSSLAFGINDAGQVVGAAYTAAGPLHAFITGPNGVGGIDLGTLGGDYSRAFGINNAGQVVGYSTTAADVQHAFITGANGVGLTDLGTLGGSDSYALGINDAGQVVGYSATAAGAYHAFITGPNGVGMTDLGTLGGSGSTALGINDAGQVVGQSSGHAFITGPNGVGMTDLNALVSLPGGAVLTEATGINNRGQVAANVSIIPEPETYAMLLAGLGLLGTLLPLAFKYSRRHGYNNSLSPVEFEKQYSNRIKSV